MESRAENDLINMRESLIKSEQLNAELLETMRMSDEKLAALKLLIRDVSDYLGTDRDNEQAYGLYRQFRKAAEGEA